MSPSIRLGDLTVWDDESGDRYFLEGHVNRRRSLAAVNRYVRVACGHADRKDQLGDVAAVDVAVAHRWFRPDPQGPGDDESMAWCDHTHPQAVPVTVVSL